MNDLIIKQKNEFASRATLYIVATPIGNMRDITLRALDILSNVNLILSEDTRVTQKLLDRYAIQTPCWHLDDFTPLKQMQKYIDMLRNGDNIAIVSDAGTPLVSDPGYKLIELAIAHEIKTEAAPGPCSVINALVLSNLPPLPFMFIGFLPHGKGSRDNVLRKYLLSNQTIICFESPKRILETLEVIVELSSEIKVCIAREMTKKFEEILRGRVIEVYNLIKERDTIKGEIVLIINGEGASLNSREENIQDEIRHLLEQQTSAKDIASLVAKKYNLARKAAYNLVLKQIFDPT